MTIFFKVWFQLSNWFQTRRCLCEFLIGSLDGPLPKLFPVIPTSNQDGHQAKNRKNGGRNFNCPNVAVKLAYIIAING
jgi:hypothetical protein